MRWCCAACAILWILHRRGYWIEQEGIAKELKIRIPKKDFKLFKHKMLTTRVKKDYGAPNLIEKDAYLVDKLFRKYKIPLKMTPIKISKIKDPRKLIIENLKKGNDIMIAFNWKGLGHKGNWGHLAVISGIIEKEDPIIIIGDSSEKKPKFWKVKLSKLVKAMNGKYDKTERGFYIFSKK